MNVHTPIESKCDTVKDYRVRELAQSSLNGRAYSTRTCFLFIVCGDQKRTVGAQKQAIKDPRWTCCKCKTLFNATIQVLY
jgi:hypothetical protein